MPKIAPGGSQLRHVVDVTIASGVALSAEIETGGSDLVGVFMPSAWDAAALTFLGRPTLDDTAQAIFAANTEVTDAGADVDRYLAIDPEPLGLSGVPYLTIRSGTLATPVNQTAARTLKCVFRFRK